MLSTLYHFDGRQQCDPRACECHQNERDYHDGRKLSGILLSVTQSLCEQRYPGHQYACLVDVRLLESSQGTHHDHLRKIDEVIVLH